MKHGRFGGLAIAAAAALTLAACSGGTTSAASSGDTSSSSSGGSADKPLRVVNVINGSLGDQGFFDDAARGMAAIAKTGAETRNIQADAENPAQWRSNLESVSGGDWDLVITGTSQMVDILNETAPKYPDQKYVIYDSVVDQPNVASIVYKQNEGSFLAGVLAGLVTEDPSTFPKANADKTVGLVGGMDIPVINDFVAGFKAGVEAVDPDIQVLVSYVGDFTDSNRGFDQATAMYDQGADVVFQVAGGAGIGVLRAAEQSDKYAIGVDANQNALHKGYILASMLKNVGVSLENAFEQFKKGDLAFGQTTEYGLANNGVGLVFEDNGGIVPDSIQKDIKDYAQKVIDGQIKVPSATS
ncbi:BMP family ABC transporter substrate-binding protein [Isoptericola sp. b441]|uniref:BMP family ABC transporter substrate-binding protein n=1 Tax=Actinotalea lenta TaxID=3064654 RepID=A0ABT9DC42_9CELL|nr:MULTISPECIES: BMP family ABC transporter substrate-binding protein [unclassified Isoptericola]MDO8106753.1 BMP family ABC transporter substrate-binding protein [Isoptericola sp. b441]MDO8121535.1 BMP family ABC transporter substrate-binding protein [Isoptericola sp. b490]